MSALRWDDPFEVSATFTTDWHIGTGAGRHGGVDRTIARDADGLPYVPATSLLGALREEIETIASGLDTGDPAGAWQEWARTLLGDRPSAARSPGEAARAPRPSALRSADLRLEDGLLAYVRTRPTTADLSRGDELTRHEVAEAMVTIRPGVAIDPETGTAKRDFFRLEERAASGLRVTGRWSFHSEGAEGEVPWQLPFLLTAGARSVRALGAKRRRGAGWCEVEIDPRAADRFDEWCTLVEGSGTTERPQPVDVRRPGSAPSWAPDDEGVRLRAEVVIDTLSPVLVHDGAAVPGSIPGAMLLGIVQDAVPDLPALLRSGTAVVTDATPDANGVRLLPWPRHVAVDPQTSDVTCLATLDGPPANTKTKPRTGGWLAAGTSGLTADVRRTQRLHAVIDRATGRTGDQDSGGGLFAYSAIDAGQRFVAQVWLSADHPLELPADREVRIGASRKDGYGRASVTWQAPRAGAITPPPPGAPALVVCESDLLVRDDRGRFDPCADSVLAALGRAVGHDAPLALVPLASAPLAPAAMSVRHRRSWNVRWGLPRPSLAAVAAGSTFAVKIPEGTDPATLERLCRDGVGSRRGEGFGRVRIEPLDGTPIAPTALATADPPPTETSGSVQSAPLWVQRAAWVRRIRSRAPVVMADGKNRRTALGEGWSRSQLGQFREAAAAGSKASGKSIPVLEPRRGPALAWRLLFGDNPVGLPDDVRDQLDRVAVAALVTAAAKAEGAKGARA